MRKLLTAFLFTTVFSLASAADNMTYNYELGDIKISVFSEGRNQGSTGILIGDEKKIKSVYPNGTYDSGVNVVFVRTPSANVLIDTGFGKNIESNLKTLGLTPADVNIVLLTHMHGDHIGGLLKDGKAVFPKAKLYLSAIEKAHWENADLPKQIFAVYGDMVQTFTPTPLDNIRKIPPELQKQLSSLTGSGKLNELLKGISSIAAPGHTPGHTIFVLESGGKKFMVWGDITHATAVQLAFPEISVTYDTDPVMAAESRKVVFEYVGANEMPFAGMHVIEPPTASQQWMTLLERFAGHYTE